TTVYIVGVYIPPSANAKEALSELYGAISDLQNAHPDGLFIIAGDFNHANLKTVLPKLHQHYTSSVTCYISKCVDDVTISKTITTRSNQKPWMTANVRALLKQRDSAFRTGDKAALKTARAKLSRAIREAKRAHAKKIH
ncbi:hypothetical protein C0J45_23244, partial [Silurus meridionalis]